MVLMEKATENRLSLHGIKVIHDHLIIMAVPFAGHIQEFILLIAETDILQSPVQFLKFCLGVFHVFLQLGQELLSEFFLSGLSRTLHLLLIAEQFRILQFDIFRLKIRISFQCGRRTEIMGCLIFHHGICHRLRALSYGRLVGLSSTGKVILKLYVTPVL